jgi:hypothetical protein
MLRKRVGLCHDTGDVAATAALHRAWLEDAHNVWHDATKDVLRSSVKTWSHHLSRNLVASVVEPSGSATRGQSSDKRGLQTVARPKPSASIRHRL